MEKYPGKDPEKKNGDVKPDGLDMLKSGSEETVEVVFDDEDAEEVVVAEGAEDVPRESGEAEGRDGDGIKAAKCVAPAFGEQSPEKNAAAGEDDGCGAFGQSGETEEEAEEEGGKGG